MLINDNVTISPAWPGQNLSAGANSSEVARIQTYLNALRVEDPNIPLLTVDGKFGDATKKAVQIFQYAHKLTADGVVGKNTWDAIIGSYNARFGGSASTYPGIALRSGSRSQDVSHMQTYLNALSALYTAISRQSVDSAYGQNMTQAAHVFQRQFSLAADGTVGKNTWAKIVAVYTALQSGSPTRISPAYAGTALRTGSSGEDVRMVQSYLNRVMNAGLTVDGVFGNATRRAVEAFQAKEGLTVDGVVGHATWDKLVAAFNATL